MMRLRASVCGGDKDWDEDEEWGLAGVVAVRELDESWSCWIVRSRQTNCTSPVSKRM